MARRFAARVYVRVCARMRVPTHAHTHTHARDHRTRVHARSRVLPVNSGIHLFGNV